jgi:serine/threonine-protein kinase
MAPHKNKVITPNRSSWFIITTVYEPGSVVAGKYRIERLLGTGGMGVVVAATHMQLGTPIALKFLHHEMTQNHNVVDRFMREARSSAQLRGENVCRVSDVGTTETGQPFIVMELLTGQDLGTVLRTNGALPLSTAAEIIMQSCIALGESHAVGIVHRDIKPGNLFWTQRPDGSALIKVLDFGVAKAPEELKLSLTQTQNVIGSPGYMSPEQLKSSKSVDARSDIWSLGIVLYELVSGKKPFDAESITELALKVAMDPAPALSAGIPPTFESVILRCLEKEPLRRFKDVAELAQALAPFVGPTRGPELAYAVARVVRGTQSPAFPQQPSIASTPTTLRSAHAVLGASQISSRRSWRVPAMIGAGAAVGIVLALVMISGKGSKRAAATAPAEATTTTKMQVGPVSPPAPAPAPAPIAAPKPAVVETKPATATKAAAEANPAAETKAAAETRTKTVAAQAEPKPETKKPAKKPTAKPAQPTKPAKPKEDLLDSRI